MEKPKTYRKRRWVALFTIFGGICCAGITMLMGLLSTHAAELGMKDSYGIFGGLVGYPTDLIWHFLGWDKNGVPPLAGLMGGSVFAAIVNGTIGAAFGFLLAIVFLFLSRGHYEDKT